MKRGKKIGINICIVLLLFLVIYYTGGFYLSQKECELNMLKAYNREYTEKVLELSHGKKTLALYGEEDVFQFDIIETEKVGFLYKMVNWYGMLGKTFDGQVMDWTYLEDYADNETEAVLLIIRTDLALDKVEVEFGDGSRKIVDEWDRNVAICYVEKEYDPYETSFSFYCYDETGRLLDEI